MMVVGLTGGIGSGKTQVSQYFKELGIQIIDADVIARKLLQVGHKEYQQVLQVFGPDILDQQGNIQREELRRQVFVDKKLLEKLEAIIHPAVRKEIGEQIQAVKGDYCIVSIPLLLEKSYKKSVDRILVVDVEEKLQIERVCQRDGGTEAQVKAIMAQQISRTDRLMAADDVIENHGSLGELKKRVCDLHHKYLNLLN